MLNLDSFLDYMRYERNRSDETVESYRMDICKSVSYTHSPSPRDPKTSRMPSSA